MVAAVCSEGSDQQESGSGECLREEEEDEGRLRD